MNQIHQSTSISDCVFASRRDDVELRPLTELKDIEKANLAWPHRNPASLPFLQRLARYNPSVGAFKKDDGTLVAWDLRYY